MKLHQITFFTADVTSAATFYQHLLGVEPVVSQDTIAIFDTGDVEIIIHETYEPSDNDIPPSDYTAFAVDDVDERFEELVNLGLEPFREPTEYDWGRSAYLTDPDGRIVELSEQ